MTTLIELPDYMYEGDAEGFLQTYLRLLTEGYSLTIPKQTSLDEITEAWQNILPRISNDFELPFAEEVAKLWRQLLRRQGAQMNETFAEEMLAILEGRPKNEGKKVETEITSEMLNDDEFYENLKPGTLTPDVVEKRDGDASNEVLSNISDSYYNFESNKSSLDIKPKNAWPQIETALEDHDVDGFLIHYLSQARDGIKPKVPVSSVLQVIRNQWEEIMMVDHNLMAEDEFLSRLSSRWFSVVNQRGLPYSMDAIEDLLTYFMENYSAPPKQKKEKKKGLLGKLFRR